MMARRLKEDSPILDGSGIFSGFVKKWLCSFLDSFAILLVLACGTIKVCPSLLDKDI